MRGRASARGRRGGSVAIQAKDESGKLVQPSSEAPVNFPATDAMQQLHSSLAHGTKTTESEPEKSFSSLHTCLHLQRVFRTCSLHCSSSANPHASARPSDTITSGSSQYPSELLPPSKRSPASVRSSVLPAAAKRTTADDPSSATHDELTKRLNKRAKREDLEERQGDRSTTQQEAQAHEQQNSNYREPEKNNEDETGMAEEQPDEDDTWEDDEVVPDIFQDDEDYVDELMGGGGDDEEGALF